MLLSSEQIVTLAPDQASVKAGRGLATPAKWPLLGQSSQALWGACQGSGSKPYQVSIDLSGPAFKCTCPSRKFPCKHGIGLMMLAVEKPASVAVGSPPQWVSDWLESRSAKSEKKAAKEKQEPASDPAAQAQRQLKRIGRMQEGGEELSRWLMDQVRSGIAGFPQQPSSYFTGVAARMVDAQVPGLASEVSLLEEMVHSGTEWPRHTLAQMGRMRLLVEGLGRIESLPEGLRGDLRMQLGWPMEKEEVLKSGLSSSGEWCVVGQSFREHNKLWERRTWLLASESSRPALVLDFSHGNRNFPVSLTPGTRFQATLFYYPSAFPQRAVFAEHPTLVRPLEDPFPTCESFSAALADYGAALAANPWLVTAPFAVRSVTPVFRDELWFLRDAGGVEVALCMPELASWELLSLSGGRPVSIFGEWTRDALTVLSLWTDRFHPFQITL